MARSSCLTTNVWQPLARSSVRGMATTAARCGQDTGTRQVLRLDFSQFSLGNEQEQRAFCISLVDAFRNEGFVKLKNHGIDKSAIAEVFQWNKRFFDLPLEAKMIASHPAQPNPHRGYSYIGQEILSKVKDFEKGDRDAVEVRDIKESYDQGPSDDKLYPNRWPEQSTLPGFRHFMESFYDQCHNVHLHLLRSLAIGLGVQPDHFQNLCGINTSELRLNHYPACARSELRDGAMRISEHTDFGTVTLLFQDDLGGLEIEDQQQRGSYFPVAPQDRYEVIVNIGDCLQRWTNNTLRSTSHRVVQPPSASAWVDSRYSVAYFAKPNRDQPVGSLPEFLREGEEPKYEDISAHEYNQQKLTLTYSA